MGATAVSDRRRAGSLPRVELLSFVNHLPVAGELRTGVNNVRNLYRESPFRHAACQGEC